MNDFPSIILIDNFNGCNLSCSMCDHKNMTRKIHIMSWMLYTKIIDEIGFEKPDARTWLIYFGDPFIVQDMPVRIQYAKKAGLTDVVLNTNGVLMTKEKLKSFMDAGLDSIYVGIDAFTKNTYDKIRIKGDFHKVVENVLNNDAKTKEKIYVQFVVSEENKHELEDFKSFWKAHGIKVKIRPKVSWMGKIDAGLDPTLKRDKNCYWLEKSFSICSDGQVSLCACDLHCSVPCGNVYENTIAEIWNGQLADHRKKNPPECVKCLDWESANAKYY